jgi:WD40 repeat protein
MTSSIQLIDDLHPVSSALEHNEEDNNECKTPTTSLVNDTEPVVSNTSIAVGFEDGSLSVFDMRVLGALNTVKALDHSPLMCMDYCAKRKELLVAGANHQMKVFKCAYPEGYPEEGSSVIPATVNISMRSEIKMKKQGTAAVKYRHDGRILVSGHWDSTVKVYDCKRMKPLAVLRHHRESVYGIDFCSRGPNRGMFASGSKDCSIALWDLFSDTILTE